MELESIVTFQHFKNTIFSWAQVPDKLALRSIGDLQTEITTIAKITLVYSFEIVCSNLPNTERLFPKITESPVKRHFKASSRAGLFGLRDMIIDYSQV